MDPTGATSGAAAVSPSPSLRSFYETELRKWNWCDGGQDVCHYYDDDAPEPGVGISFEPTVRWLNLYIKERNLPAVLGILLRVRAFVNLRMKLWIGVRDTQKCHPWFPSVLHSLISASHDAYRWSETAHRDLRISDNLLNTALPVNPSAPEMQFCEAVVVAAHLVEQAKTSGWSDDDSDFLTRELLGCSRPVTQLELQNMRPLPDSWRQKLANLDPWTVRTALSSQGCPKSRLPVFRTALGTSVLDCPSKALAYFAPREVVDAETMTIKAIGPDGSTQTLTFCSNFKIESVLLMAQKAFRIPCKCEMYQPRDQQIFDLQSDAGLILEHQSTVFIGSKAAALSFTIRLTGTPVTVSLALVANGKLHTPAQLRAQIRAQIKRLLELMKAAAWFFTQRSPRWQHRRQQALPLLGSVWVEYAAFRRVLLIFPCVATACHRLVTAPSDMRMARMSWSWAEVVMERVTRGRVKRVPQTLADFEAAAAARVAGGRYSCDIFESLYKGDGVSVLCHLIADARSVNKRDKTCSSYRTPLHVSACRGHLEICRLLLQCNADVKAEDAPERDTPLHYSARHGHLKVTRLLVESKADVAARNRWGGENCDIYPICNGNTALTEAISSKNAEIVAYLRSIGAPQ